MYYGIGQAVTSNGYPTCNSGVITVKFDYKLEFVSDNNTPPTYTVQPYTSNIGYGNYQWYRNGNAISGATSSTYTPTQSGAYSVYATTTSCGNRTSDTLHYYAPNNQCSSSAVSYSTCSTSFTLSHPSPLAGYEVYWYECDANGSNATILNNGNPANTLNVYPNANSTSQAYYYYYICVDVFSNSTCNGNLITVEFSKNLTITSNSNTLPATLSANPFSNNITYSNYQWYRNGQIIPNAISSTYYTTLPGEYYLTCSSSCGSSESNVITMLCYQNTMISYQNYTFPTGNTTISSSTIFLSGQIIIPSDAHVILSYCNIQMDNCSEIIVENSTSINNNGGKLELGSCCIYSFENWNGIFVNGYDEYIAKDSRSGSLNIENSKITDATIGVFGIYNAPVHIVGSEFENNQIHFQLYKYNGTNSTTTSGPEIEISTTNFNNLKNQNANCTLPNNHHFPSTNLRYYVYLEEANTIEFYNCNFNSTILNSRTNTIGIHNNNNNGIQNGYFGMLFRNCHFDGYYKTVVNLEEAKDIKFTTHFGSSYLKGYFDFGIKSINTKEIQVYNTQIENIGSTGSCGLYFDQNNNVDINNTIIQNFEIGCIHLLDHSNQNNTNNSAIITMSTFTNNIYGLILAPKCNPITTNNCNQNYYTNSTNSSINLECNKFYYNEWGIIGAGDLNEQGNANTSWGSFFYPANAQSSTSIYGDIAWYNNSNQNTINYYNYKPIIIGNNTISIDGNNVGINNSDILGFQSNNENSCYQSFAPVFSKSNLNNNTLQNEIKIYPNPFFDDIRIEIPNDSIYYTIIIDICGKVVYQNFTSNLTQTEINLSHISKGLYIIQLNNIQTGKTEYTKKIIKQ